jgi:hypothetical protein
MALLCSKSEKSGNLAVARVLLRGRGVGKACLSSPYLAAVTLAVLGFGPISAAYAEDISPPPAQTGGSNLSEVALRRVREHVQRGLDLAERQAVYSAHEEFAQALRMVAAELDLVAGTRQHEAAVIAGLRTLNSVDSFSADSISERTAGTAGPAPGSAQLSTIQQRLLAVQEQLAFGLGHESEGSRAVYFLGRSQIAILGETAEERALAGPKAIALYQTALAVDPANYVAANELGVTFARYGQLANARQALSHAASINPCPEIWRNLSIVCERMGDKTAAEQARAQGESVAARASGGASDPSAQARASAANVRWVSPTEFVQCSGNVDLNEPIAKRSATPSAAAMPASPAPKREGGPSLTEWISSGLRTLGGKSTAGVNR